MTTTPDDDDLSPDAPVEVSQEMSDFAERVKNDPRVFIHTWHERPERPKRYRAWSGS